MKDCFNRQIQIGDICVFEYNGHLDSRPVWGFEDDYVEIADYHETLIRKAKDIVDITAIEREVREQQFLNSVKALDVKPNDTIVASLIPNQIPMGECENVFEQIKKAFPDNKVTLVMGLDVNIENGSE